jgi:hypothetical protein
MGNMTRDSLTQGSIRTAEFKNMIRGFEKSSYSPTLGFNKAGPGGRYIPSIVFFHGPNLLPACKKAFPLKTSYSCFCVP